MKALMVAARGGRLANIKTLGMSHNEYGEALRQLRTRLIRATYRCSGVFA